MTFNPSSLRLDYGDPLAEARVCRHAAALFDFSFVARGRVSGPGALRAVQRLTTRRLDRLRPGHIAYGLREDATGRLLADLTIWRLDAETYELMSGRREDVRDLVALADDCSAVDLSDETSIFAVQGPRALEALGSLGAPASLRDVPYFGHAAATLAGRPCTIGRLGYTGEPGFEIIARRSDGGALWQAAAEILPRAGFCAANILRIEAGFVLFANELRLPVTAYEAGLRQFADANKRGGAPDGVPGGDCRLVTFRAKADVPPLWLPPVNLERPAARGELVATSACASPLADGTLGLGFVRGADLLDSAPPTFVSDALGAVEIVTHPFHDPAKQRPRAPWPRLPR